MPLASPTIVENRINFKVLTIIAGVVVALVILFSLWFVDPEQPPVATGGQAKELTQALKFSDIGKMVFQTIF
jgi:hypothetical protein